MRRSSATVLDLLPTWGERGGCRLPGPKVRAEIVVRNRMPQELPWGAGAARRHARVHRALRATLMALAMGVVTLPNRTEAAIVCSDAAFQNLVLPDPATPEADGWTPTGDPLKGVPPNPPGSVPEIASGDQNVGAAEGTAQLFKKQIGNVLCVYLRRNFNPDGTANGVLCFDEDDCSVCAWDVKTGPGVDPKGTQISDMLTPSSYGDENGMDDCSGCHVTGPAMPMQKMYDQIDLEDLMNTCVSKGGPEWVDAPASWAEQDTNNKIPKSEFPDDCGQCHGPGFLKPQANQTIWCDFAGQAFQEGGSMSDYLQEDCTAFMERLMCDPKECSDLTPGEVPSMSNQALVGLAALMIVTGGLVIWRRQSLRGVGGE